MVNSARELLLTHSRLQSHNPRVARGSHKLSGLWGYPTAEALLVIHA